MKRGGLTNLDSSGEDEFTESQKFQNFLNAKDSDDEDKALGSGAKKKNAAGGAGGFYNSKPGGQTYPSYSGNTGGGGYGAGYGTSYGGYGGGTYGSGYGGGYGNTSANNTAAGAGSGYGTGYGGYGGASYGSGYGAGTGSGSGYGAGGGSGYGAGGGYGSGYGGGNAYSGYDITGFGGSGYGGAGAGTGYKDEDDDEDDYGDDYEDEDDENKEEGGFDLDLESVMKRKAAQKAAKEAEEKKAEEEKQKKAKAAQAAQASSLKPSGLKTSVKKDKTAKGKVSFDLGGEIPDDSENENNQNISHISEKSHSSDSSDARNRSKKTSYKKEEEKPSLSSKILNNISDDEKDKSSDYGKKDKLESVDDLDSEKTPKTYNTYGKTTTKSPAKKEEAPSDSYADDFEESSKFGSSDYGKAAIKTTTKPFEKKADEFEESSNYLSESKDARVEEKPSVNDKKSAQVYQPTTSSLTQNYETRAAKDYVYESLLNDERRRVDKLETQLGLGGDQLKSVQQLVQEKDLTIRKLETQTQNLQRDLDIYKDEALDLDKKNKIYEVENEDLQRRIEVLESKVLELESQKRILTKDNEEKTKSIKERRDYLEKNFESKALSELRTQFENEKDLLLLRVEELQEENKAYREEVDKIKEESRLYRTNFRQKAESDQEVKRLKQEIMLLELKLQNRDQIKAKRQPELQEQEKENVNLISGIPELDKETQMQELLIKGFQKENEKLMTENKLLKREIEELHSRLYDENKKATEMKVKLVNNTDSVLITDKEIDIETKKMLGAENLISKNDLKAAQMKIQQLHQELQTREDTFKQREMELKYEMDRLRAQKMDLEAKVGGVDMGSLKKQDEDYKQLVKTVEDERRMHEIELRDLKAKLNWYIENQETLTSKDEVIRQKNETIKRLEEETARILSDPNTNLDAKSKHFNKISNEDKKRIKQLERDVENLEEALKKRNPGVYDKMKSQQDEGTALKELKQSLKKVQDEKASLETEYETKLNDLRQKFDKMRLGYENKSNDPTGARPERDTNTNDNQEKEILKARIKDLEKEVDDAKKYYLKKAQQLKDNNKKGGKVIEKPLKNTKETLVASKKVSFDVKDEKEFQYNEDKENVKRSSNVILDEGELNLMENLATLPLTPAYAVLSAFENYKNNLVKGLETHNNQLVSSSTQELARVINSTLSEFPPKEEILQKIKRAEQLVTEKKDPLPTTEAAQKILHDLVWTELRKEKSVMTRNTMKAPAKLNNFFDQDQQSSEVSNRKVIVLEDNLKKKDEDLISTQQKLNQVMSENVRLLKDKSNLELILQQLPKNPRSLDFATMEKKLEIMERNYKENELEMKNAFRKAYNMDPFQTSSDAEKVKASYEKEISQLRSTLDRKNQEIYVFRQEMDVILKELNKLRRNKV